MAENCLRNPFSHSDRLAARLEDIERNKIQSKDIKRFIDGLDEVAKAIQNEVVNGTPENLASPELVKTLHTIRVSSAQFDINSPEGKVVSSEMARLQELAPIASKEIEQQLKAGFDSFNPDHKVDLVLSAVVGSDNRVGRGLPLQGALVDFQKKIILGESGNSTGLAQLTNWDEISRKIKLDIATINPAEMSSSKLVQCYELLRAIDQGKTLTVFGLLKLDNILSSLPSEYLKDTFGEKIIDHAFDRVKDLSGEGEKLLEKQREEEGITVSL